MLSGITTTSGARSSLARSPAGASERLLASEGSACVEPDVAGAAGERPLCVAQAIVGQARNKTRHSAIAAFVETQRPRDKDRRERRTRDVVDMRDYSVHRVASCLLFRLRRDQNRGPALNPRGGRTMPRLLGSVSPTLRATLRRFAEQLQGLT